VGFGLCPPPPHPPTPNPQSPIPNPQSPLKILNKYFIFKMIKPNLFKIIYKIKI
jgi:hypothetical protein